MPRAEGKGPFEVWVIEGLFYLWQASVVVAPRSSFNIPRDGLRLQSARGLWQNA